MPQSIFSAPIDLKKHSSLIYAEGAFGLGARKKHPMRAKTADGILRYAEYDILGIIESTSKEKTAGEVLPVYLFGHKNYAIPIFSSLKEAKKQTDAKVLIIGTAPEGGALPAEYKGDIEWAIKHHMDIVSGTHYALSDNRSMVHLAKKNKTILWDSRKCDEIEQIPIGSARAYHIKKPIVLTVGTDAAIGKMTVTYEMHQAALRLGAKSRVIPTGQTTIMIEGWGASIDALPADFMAGAVEAMLYESEDKYDIFFVEGQGSLFHPAFANTTISLIHGSVPSHMVLVHRLQRKHSIGSKLIKLPDLNRAIEQYESSVLPFYRNTKVAAVALHTQGLSSDKVKYVKKEVRAQTGLPAFDVLLDPVEVEEFVKGMTNIV
jgi:uncharacterized NAD-dependent epimerase/dehydratase family protein